MSDRNPPLLPPPSWYRRDRVKVDPKPTGEKEQAETFDNERKELGNRSFRQNIRERRLYSRQSYKLTVRWVCFIITETFIQQIMSIWNVGLSEKEFIAVITTTTASMFGFWWLVGRYLFHGPDKPPDA